MASLNCGVVIFKVASLAGSWIFWHDAIKQLAANTKGIIVLFRMASPFIRVFDDHFPSH
jgi:hypothetical protein